MNVVSVVLTEPYDDAAEGILDDILAVDAGAKTAGQRLTNRLQRRLDVRLHEPFPRFCVVGSQPPDAIVFDRLSHCLLLGQE
jgi:hypothetical protein